MVKYQQEKYLYCDLSKYGICMIWSKYASKTRHPFFYSFQREIIQNVLSERLIKFLKRGLHWVNKCVYPISYDGRVLPTRNFPKNRKIAKRNYSLIAENEPDRNWR